MVSPLTLPVVVLTTTLPSWAGSTPPPPLELIVPVPANEPVRIITMPPPVPPDDANAVELLRVPAPPPPPSTTRVTDAANAAPPWPPTGWFEFQLLPP